jgi:hypothetical protein
MMAYQAELLPWINTGINNLFDGIYYVHKILFLSYGEIVEYVLRT